MTNQAQVFYLREWFKEDWKTGSYQPSLAFEMINEHAAVIKGEGEIVALTGPAQDPESQLLAQLFAHAPTMRATLQTIQAMIENSQDQAGPLCGEIRKLCLGIIRKVDGDGGGEK